MMMNLIEMTPLAWIVTASLFGGLVSVLIAAAFALNAQRKWVPMLVSYAIGALLGAVFLELLPHAFEVAPNVEYMTATILLGILLFFTLEKLVLWRHCHGDHCEAHAIHDEAHCPDNEHVNNQQVKFKLVSQSTPTMLTHRHEHEHSHDDGRSGMMIMIGDTFHNFVDGILIAAAFMVDIQLGLVTALAIIAHEIPQEIGDFLILLHSGYSKQKALLFNMFSSFATLIGGLLAYSALQTMQAWVPYILSLAVASMLYVAVADLIPGLHKRTAIKDTLQQISLILLGVSSIFFAKLFLEG
jgi:zinc and cadmium transporter